MDLLDDRTLPLIAGTLLLLILSAFIILFVVLYRKAQLKFQLERQQFRQALLQTEVEIREQTLANISRDLHDNFGQVASLIKINLNMLSEDQPEEDRQRLAESMELLKTLIRDMRALSSSLNGDNLRKTGLAAVIQSDIERVNRSGFLEMQLQDQSREKEPDPEISIFLYRMFQEMLNNILKHSQASKAQVVVSVENNTLVMQVSDNGIGIPAGNSRQGNGLQNIRERCKMIGARYTIESSPDNGTFIEIALPI